jgi:ribosome maturation factor RimP
MEKLESLKKSLSEVLEEKKIIVDEITISKKGKYNFLTIVLDKVGVIDLDGIVEATNIINPIVDKYDICDDSYILDVISKERNE